MNIPSARVMLGLALAMLALWMLAVPQDAPLLAAEPRRSFRTWFRELFGRRKYNPWPQDQDDADTFVHELHGDEYEHPEPLRDPAPTPPAGIDTRSARHAAATPWSRQVRKPASLSVRLPSLQPQPRPLVPGEGAPPWMLSAPVEEEHEPFVDPNPTNVRGMLAIMDEDPDGVGSYVRKLPRYED